ncbi:hypothetical protein GCM10023187_57500 [Nibrella viscosa]|uniref:Small-conductance mechanosensitive channel n=1 Tax=Nibrella viscosa TaxID=1084524 RepID=A0ABP8L3M1_9BACT
MREVLEKVLFQNTVQDYLLALGVILVGIVMIGIFRRTILARVREWTRSTDSHFDDFVVDSIARFGIPALYFGVVTIGLNLLILTPRAEGILKVASTVVITFLIVRLVSSAILLFLRSFIRRQNQGDEKLKQVGGLMLLINVVIWAVGLLFIFDNMGYNVTTVVTGLGIGGIAVALAAQNILGDLFNYLVIFFDRPFEVGDFITVDNKMGSVDYIGIKTTRVKSLTGEQLIFANSDLTKSRIHNFKRMDRRRIAFTVKVTYQAELDQLKAIPILLKALVEEQSDALFDRAHFAAYGDSSLNFDVVYFVLSTEFNRYMDIQQTINLRIYEEFKARGIEFAYPTQALYWMNQPTEVDRYS